MLEDPVDRTEAQIFWITVESNPVLWLLGLRPCRPTLPVIEAYLKKAWHAIRCEIHWVIGEFYVLEFGAIVCYIGRSSNQSDGD